ncbi:MAG: hypothetical protein ABL930_06510 [Pseudobdellovibrio sp.]
MKKTATKPTKTTKKPNLLAELLKRKMEAQNSGEIAESKSKFLAKKPRNMNNSNVGPSWGGRKGN